MKFCFCALLSYSFVVAAFASEERHGKEIYIPFCQTVPQPFYAGFLPEDLGPFDSDAVLIVRPAASNETSMHFGKQIEVDDLYAETEGCALSRIWARELDWLVAPFHVVGFCSLKYGQPHATSYLTIYKAKPGRIFQIEGIYSGGLDAQSQTVRATASFARVSKEAMKTKTPEITFQLYIQESSDDWLLIHEDRVPVSTAFERKTWEIARRDIPPGVPVRFVASVNQEGFGQLRLYDARLYGAQCYADFARSDACL